MSMHFDSQSAPRRVVLDHAGDRDLFLVKFFNQIYAWMCVGVAVTAAVGYFSQGFMVHMRGLGMVFFLALAVFAIATRQVALKVSAGAGLAMFIVYAALIGLVTGYIFMIYRAETLIGAFCVTAGTFAGMSLIGFITKKDLTKVGGILIMCVWGLFLASIVNYFIASSAFSWFITYAVLAVFMGLTIYDTQKLKNLAQQYEGQPALLNKLAVLGSLELYVDFINMFFSILRIMGSRR